MNKINVSFSFPSETPGAVLDLKKGRATISFNGEELALVQSLFTLLAMNGLTEMDASQTFNNPAEAAS